MPSEWVDFKKIKEDVSIEAVMKRYGVELRRVNASSLRGMCPLPAHASKTSPSFCVNTEKNIWACQSDSCVKARSGKKGGNVLDFVAVVENCSIRDAALKIANWFSVTSERGDVLPKILSQSNDSKKLVAEKKMEAEVIIATSGRIENKPLGFALKNIDHSHPYLIDRGITKETAEKFGTGFFSGKGSMLGRVVIPIHNGGGEIVAYAGRSIDGSEPKYKLPGGFQKSIELFNLHRALATGSDCAIVVEGFFDCKIVHQAGYFSVVALMGSTLSNEQEKILTQKFSRVILMLDGDETGRESAHTIATRLMQKLFIKLVHVPLGKQPDELSSEELNALIGKL